MLPLKTLKCPSDKEPLHFEVYGGMRIKQQAEPNVWKYNAKCPKCGEYYEVKAPKEQN